MANTINWEKSYSESYWGTATTPKSWGDDYIVEYLPSDLNGRVQINANTQQQTTLIEK